MRGRGIVPLTTLDEIGCPGKGRNDFPSNGFRVAAGMIEMEVCVDNEIDVLWLKLQRCQRFTGLAGAHAIHLLKFLVPLVSNTRIHQNLLPSGFDEENIHGKPDSIHLIGRQIPRSDHSGDHAEHRPAVKPKFTEGEEVEGKATKNNRGNHACHGNDQSGESRCQSQPGTEAGNTKIEKGCAEGGTRTPTGV